MPNTLAHIGVNGISTRTVIKNPDLKWILLGTIIPDIPWMLQRAAKIIYPEINGYDLRLYVIVQATLFFSLILSFWFSQFSVNRLKTFFILGAGSVLHLLLDATQKKWGNGVHFLAPFNWDLLNFGWYWPESMVTYLITIAGLFYVFYYRKELFFQKADFHLRNFAFHFIHFVVLLIYFLLPFYFMPNAETADNHFVHTLRDYTNRTGKYIEFDRRKVFDDNGEFYLVTFANENIKLKSDIKLNEGVYSIKGVFLAPETIRVKAFHKHNTLFRDGASYSGLLLIILAWVVPLWKRKIKPA